ncbi:probable LRR receptor-like serine/threonine-protein kinase At4g31250 [Andrographis paniculata]|uniref:probable LRR receptor-like serine/threonine-protein kinase At4g31250 n=1 Tax=Andrographis paniculata TaxID=175694 RepID=UPI0021E797BE|nr:probable LRR receptor-like serine/threonine-protein kinase At4g31250 [Andrographis paniculata]
MARIGVIVSPRLRASTLLLTILILFSASFGDSESDVLVKFKDSLKNNGALSNWHPGTPPCNGDAENWVGLLCEQGTVWGLRLENMGLEGTIDVDTLTKMPKLRVLSLVNNNFNGPLPEVKKLHSLKAVFLSNNKFSGEIPPDFFAGMLALKKVHLANNQLSGEIPVSLSTLPRLMEVTLQNNEFTGLIPPFPPGRIKTIDLSNNKLQGEVPRGLSQLPASGFEGNLDLCGAPLKSCTAPNKLSVGTIVTVVILLVLTSAALVAVVVILLRRRSPAGQQAEAGSVGSRAAPAMRQGNQKAADLDKMEKGAVAAPPPPSKSSPGKKQSSQAKKSEHNMKITFLKEDGLKFDMSDLLKASAEVLGSGVFGSTYKADLGNGEVVVVKRFKHMSNVNKQDFSEHMRRLGRLSHQNLLPISGYYYRKEEKLFVTDYVDNFSLAFHLHAGNTPSRTQSPLNWPARLKIVKGVAKGLQYLYNELPSLTAPHGHLKSSNVLLDGSNNPLLNDYCLVPIVNREEAQQHIISYKSPEFRQSGRITKKTDVWSLGILIIEILTGKFPPDFLQDNKGGSEADVAAWVESVVGEEPTAEVFDKTIGKAKRCDAEMMKLLKLGLELCQVDVELRPDILEAVEKIEEIKEE